MLVRIAFGRRAGEVVDLLPQSAHAMLADGRAVHPELEADAGRQPGTAPVDSGTPHRVDRGLPRLKPRRGR